MIIVPLIKLCHIYQQTNTTHAVVILAGGESSEYSNRTLGDNKPHANSEDLGGEAITRSGECEDTSS